MSRGYRIVAGTGLDPGDRAYQQDQLCLIAHPLHPGCLLGVVADGMGGRSGGRKAADQVMLTAQQLFKRYDAQADDPAVFLARLVQEAHIVIKLIAISAEEEPHSTIAAFLLLPGGDCHWLHSGDSRLYHFRQANLLTRTLDHSYVQQLVEHGELSSEAARDDARSNILISCLGGTQLPQTSLHVARVQPGDALLACSDGLWHHFSDAELGNILVSLTPREACEFLVQKARKRAAGRSDNISVIVVKFEPLA